MFELIYTSAPQGLLPGRAGFCTVAMTGGMPPNLMIVLENLSGYNFVQRNGAFPSECNPICCYYIKMRYGMQLLYAAGRIAPNGLDYSQRNNKIAHHLLLESPDELNHLSGGAAELFTLPELFCTDFQDEPHQLPYRSLPQGCGKDILPAATWQKFLGDAGFAAMIVEKFRTDPLKPFYIKYPPQVSCAELLQLVQEVCALLEVKERQNFTFSTYFSSSNAASECFLRMLPDFSPLLENLRRFHSGDLLELDKAVPYQLPADGGNLYALARTGQTNSPRPPEIRVKLQLSQQKTTVRPSIYVPPPAHGQRRSSRQPSTAKPGMTGRRQLLFIGIAGVVLLVALLGMLFKLSATGQSVKKSGITPGTGPATPPAVYPASTEPPPAPQSKPQNGQTALPGTTTRRPLIPEPDTPRTVPVQKASVKQAAGENKTILPLPERSAFELFKQLSEQKHIAPGSDQLSLQLPPLLKNTRRINVQLLSGKFNASEFVKSIHDHQTVVLAARRGKNLLTPLKNYQDGPHLLWEYDPLTNHLNIQFIARSKQYIMPELSDIKAVNFELADRIYSWPLTFQSSYPALLAPGKVIISEHGQNQYQPSELEILFQDNISVQIGNCTTSTFRSSKFEFELWNRTVDEYTASLTRVKLKNDQIASLAAHHAPLPHTDTVQTQIAWLLNSAKNKNIKKFPELKNDIDKFLDQFFTTAPIQRNSATSAIFDRLGQKLEDILEDKLEEAQLEDSEEDKLENDIEKYCNTLNDKIAEINELQNYKKQLTALEKELTDTRQKLKYHREQLLSTGEKISLTIRDLLDAMTTSAPPDGSAKPQKVNLSQIKELARAIQKQVRITLRPAVSKEFSDE